MPDTRPVWLTREQRDLLALHGWRKESDAWDAAPADAVAAARSALTDCEYRSPGMGGEPEPLHDLYQPEGCRIIRAAAVLAALGRPKGDA